MAETLTTQQQSYFRGYWSIKEVIDLRLGPLAEWLQNYKRDACVITLRARDYDLIKRWPRAAAVLSITVTPQEGMMFRGFKLKRGKGQARYQT